MPQTNKTCVQTREGDRGQRVSVEERTQGVPQSNTKGERQRKGKGNRVTRQDTVTKKNAMHNNKEKAGTKGMYVCPRPKTYQHARVETRSLSACPSKATTKGGKGSRGKGETGPRVTGAEGREERKGGGGEERAGGNAKRSREERGKSSDEGRAKKKPWQHTRKRR